MWCQSVRISRLLVTAQTGLTVSLQLEEAGRVSIMRKAGDILFAFLFQIFIFQVRHCATTPSCQWLCGVSGGARAVERGGRQSGGGGRAGVQRQEAPAQHPPPRLLQPPARRGRAPAEAAKLTLRISSLEAVYIHRIYIYIYSTLISFTRR